MTLIDNVCISENVEKTNVQTLFLYYFYNTDVIQWKFLMYVFEEFGKKLSS